MIFMAGGAEVPKIGESSDPRVKGAPVEEFCREGGKVAPGEGSSVSVAGDNEQARDAAEADRKLDHSLGAAKIDSLRQSLQEFAGTKEGWQEEIGQKGWEAYSTRPLIMDFGNDVKTAFSLESHSEVLKGILTGLGVLDHEVNRKTLQRAVYYALGVKLDEGVPQEAVQKFFKDEIKPRFENFTQALGGPGFQKQDFPLMTRLFSQYTGLNFIDENGVFQISGLTAFLTLPMAEIEKKVQLFKQYREALPRQLQEKPSGEDFDKRIGEVSEIIEHLTESYNNNLIDSFLDRIHSSWGISKDDNNSGPLARAVYELEMQYRSKLDSSKNEADQKKDVVSFLESFVPSRFQVLEEALKKGFPGTPPNDLPELISQFSEKSGLHFIDANKNLQSEGLSILLSLSDEAIQKKVELFREHAEFEALAVLKIRTPQEAQEAQEAAKAAIKKAEENLPEGSRFGARLFRLFRWLLSLSGVAAKVVDEIVHPPESDKEAKDLVRREELWTALNKHLFGESDQKLSKELFVPQEGKPENKSNLGIFRAIFHKKHEGTYADYSSFFQAYIQPEEKQQLIDACNSGDFADEGKKGMELLRNIFKKRARG